MKRFNFVIPLCAAVALTLPGAAMANNGKPNKAHNAQQVASNCPPGLAKKNPPCVPPGQAKKQLDPIYENDRYDDHYDYRIGERVNGDYVVIERPQRYGLDPNATYYRVGDGVYQVDRETSEILAVIGLANRLLN
ncbi:excinuclease ABC subunit A [Phaeobacter sp. 22II1-1F12B]|uniref:excinuclease ABC subunit A n=1 Tax=Phaeobacter sp. 22II1-1F12B TaxID=1317111 RepID=UPI000B765326|nr:excinuclease ABC subunit A [Phaeobacter sp. 22II1-1F12B]OWU81424.1 hypothetical protein ATO1_05375 [Phaeobacter sp. 22II1-1F12B]